MRSHCSPLHEAVKFLLVLRYLKKERKNQKRIYIYEALKRGECED
jgi:hypothetical protein